MIKVTLIGSGNVAQHLVSAFQSNSDIEIVQIYSRKANTEIPNIAPQKIIHSFTELREAEVYILAVSDDAISIVSEQLPFENRLVVHTSGAASLDFLSPKNRKGVFYPLQTFTKGKAVNFKEIPICIEAQTTSDFEILEKVAKSISGAVHAIHSEQRKALHVAAVFVNNFTNHLYKIGQEICLENDVPFDILKPLIMETASKIKNLSPDDAQTGPAKRKDASSIEAHQSFLRDEHQNKLYKILTQSIQHHGKEL